MRKSALVTQGWGPGPLHTLTSLECEQWPLQNLRQILEVHLYQCNVDPSQKKNNKNPKRVGLTTTAGDSFFASLQDAENQSDEFQKKKDQKNDTYL